MKPEQRIAAIECSLRCFALGWLAFLPLVGIPCGVAALRAFCVAFFTVKPDWNPGRAYLYWGMILAVLGLLAHALVIVLVLINRSGS